MLASDGAPTALTTRTAPSAPMRWSNISHEWPHEEQGVVALRPEHTESATAKRSPSSATANNRWVGAQATVQQHVCRSDHEQSWRGSHAALCSHDHFGPSTHQQAGLYAGLIVEPTGAKWLSAIDRSPLGNGPAKDGGPTSWQALIEYPLDPKDPKSQWTGVREFALEVQDSQLAYGPYSRLEPIPYKRYDVATIPPGTPLPRSGWSDADHAINPPKNTENGRNLFAPQLLSSG